MTVTFIHNNAIRVVGGTLVVDRKFHNGMLNYVEAIQGTIETVNPLAARDAPVMDAIELPIAALPYRVVPLALHKHQPTPEARLLLADAITRSSLVIGDGYGSLDIARKLGKRFLMVAEYDLATRITIGLLSTTNPVRAAWSVLNVLAGYGRSTVPAMRTAYSVHCNGYPMYAAAARHNPRPLLYLDSRMGEALIIGEEALEHRLRNRKSPLRLIFSGRYEAMKGALDAVESALVCLERGVAVELDCYGQGSERHRMLEAASASQGAIRIHAAIPFPQLVAVTSQSDLFVCCHRQSDPSCTYLEALGAGTPVVGYPNRMWTALHAASAAGRVARKRTPRALADEIVSLVNSPPLLDEASRSARRFALEHSFEKEFRKRTDAINHALM